MKDGPIELSSKRPVSRFRQVLTSKRQSRDPRFSSKSGSLNPSVYSQSYGFISNLQDSELKELEKAKSKTKVQSEAESISKLIQSIKSRKEAKINASASQEIKRSWKKQEMERVSQGKKPFYLKKTKLKEMELIQKYKSLKESGDKVLEKYMEKKRKKKASKEKLGMPKARRE